MSKLDEFKLFAKKNPSLVKYVNSGEMNWQKFYEMYDMYGENNEVWSSYIKKTTEEVGTSAGFDGIVSWLKNIDLDSVKTSINNMQRVVGLLQDFGSTNKSDKQEYKPRPIYKHFED